MCFEPSLQLSISLVYFRYVNLSVVCTKPRCLRHLSTQFFSLDLIDGWAPMFTLCISSDVVFCDQFAFGVSGPYLRGWLMVLVALLDSTEFCIACLQTDKTL